MSDSRYYDDDEDEDEVLNVYAVSSIIDSLLFGKANDQVAVN